MSEMGPAAKDHPCQGDRCKLPRLWNRKVGSVHVCPMCRTMWFVDLWFSWADSQKEWSRVSGPR